MQWPDTERCIGENWQQGGSASPASGSGSTRIRVAPDEVTCRVCGETFPGSWSGCPRCANEGGNDHNEMGWRTYKKVPTIPTLSYLRDGEWERV